MTMHLLPVYFNSSKLNSKRKKRKLSQKEIQSRKEHEKFLKKMGVKKPTTDFRYDFPNYESDKPSLPTSDRICGNTSKKSSNTYSGTKIIGIATMHKSNLVPVTNRESAKDISTMRRN